VYAIVRAGGRQEKVAIGDLISLDRVGAKPGDVVTLPTVMIVDGGKVNAKASNIVVTAEVIDHTKGKKIEILRYKNKTGYRRRQGHRSALTEVQIIAIGDLKIAAGDKIAAKTGKKLVNKTPKKVSAAPAVAAPKAAPAKAEVAEKVAAPAAKKAATPAAKKSAPAKKTAPAKKAAAKKAAPAKKAPAKKAAPKKTEK
jgi:large subunit ribosomal protein L21